MRMSCNGCRVLRKRCSESCMLRPCLEWIKSEESQANATVFLAKFYGRTGLINLISNGPQHSRPALFKSLLYEACGRLSNPIYGAVGLLCSGNWEVCHAGVESILDGSYEANMANQSNIIGQPSELHKINGRGKFKCVNYRKKPKSKELELLKSIQISSEENDRTKMHQDKCSFQNDFLCNPIINPNVDGLYVQNGEGEMDIELTLGASSPPVHKLAD
ncbi:hypothetical protein SUGI_0102650 [Cryptomeria japonica]|uniref:LOB domain-containing protein 40 n=1 Tax=Cryptomeria japonica TaxID=3369 RepID=UPI0024089958|nr:LOB domain-containing protein 40 [Cryptomeria japonica]XP_057838476.2 LOB domain-containing protein 40 [Cryptomeria japonica]GLJ09148.1 hypothetical protein SUGI_0102650 [Cryptomeria japonica]